MASRQGKATLHYQIRWSIPIEIAPYQLHEIRTYPHDTSLGSGIVPDRYTGEQDKNKAKAKCLEMTINTQHRGSKVPAS